MGLFGRLRGKGHPRVAFIGIDGVPFTLLSEYPDEFPNFAALADAGSAGDIDGIVSPELLTCWPAFTTSVNPGEIGVYDFQDREVGSYDTHVLTGRDVQATRAWDRVIDAGRETTVMNISVTLPPQRNVQHMVSGFLSPGIDKAVYPDDFRDALSEMNYKIDVSAKLGHDEDKIALMEDAWKVLDWRYEAFKRYINQDSWDLFFGVSMTTDCVNHFLFKDYERDRKNRDVFMKSYRTVDDYLDRIRDALPEDVTLVVAPDHGFTSLDYEVYCNTWLEESGWLSYEDDDHDALSDIDEGLKAYSLIPDRFLINLGGHEPRGLVPRSEYEDVHDKLKAELEALEGPDGNKVADRVVVKEDAFRGDHNDIAPDFVVIPNHGFDLKSGLKGHDDVFGVDPRNGMHSFNNATLHVDDPGTVIEDADLYNTAPTILDLMDAEYSRTELDGTSLIQQ